MVATRKRPHLSLVPTPDPGASAPAAAVVEALVHVRQIARSARALRALLPRLQGTAPRSKLSAFGAWVESLLSRACAHDETLSEAEPERADTPARR